MYWGWYTLNLFETTLRSSKGVKEEAGLVNLKRLLKLSVGSYALVIIANNLG